MSAGPIVRYAATGDGRSVYVWGAGHDALVWAWTQPTAWWGEGSGSHDRAMTKRPGEQRTASRRSADAVDDRRASTPTRRVPNAERLVAECVALAARRRSIPIRNCASWSPGTGGSCRDEELVGYDRAPRCSPPPWRTASWPRSACPAS